MAEKKFDPKKLEKLNNPQRLKDIPPAFIRGRLINPTPQTFIEIGAGTGFFCIAFIKEFKPKRVYACDLSPTMIEWMQDNVAPEYPAIVPIQTTEDQVPLDDGCAELVFMINLHHELHNPVNSLKEGCRLLKPGGEIFIVDWKKQQMEQGPPIEIRCDPEEVKSQLEQAGFNQIASYNDLKKQFLVTGRKPSP